MGPEWLRFGDWMPRWLPGPLSRGESACGVVHPACRLQFPIGQSFAVHRVHGLQRHSVCILREQEPSAHGDGEQSEEETNPFHRLVFLRGGLRRWINVHLRVFPL
jgi:hypothetical protein